MMRKIGNNELDLARETLGLEEWNKIHATRAGFRFEDEVSGLEIVAPRFYHVGVDHRLMNPASLLPDLHNRIPAAIGRGLMSSAYGFLMGGFDSVNQRFSLLEAVEDDDLSKLNTSRIMVFSFFDRAIGAPGLKAAERKQLNHLYFHEFYDDPVYKVSGIQVFVLEVASSSQLRTLVEQALRTREKVLAYAEQSLQQFEVNKDRVAQSIRTQLNSLMEIALPWNYNLMIYDDSPDWTGWVIYELPQPGTKSCAGVVGLSKVGARYWHDQPGTNQCKADVKRAREKAMNGQLF